MTDNETRVWSAVYASALAQSMSWMLSDKMHSFVVNIVRQHGGEKAFDVVGDAARAAAITEADRAVAAYRKSCAELTR